MRNQNSRDAPTESNSAKSLFALCVVILLTIGILGLLSSAFDTNTSTNNGEPDNETVTLTPVDKPTKVDPTLIDFEGFKYGEITLPIGDVIFPQNVSSSESSVSVVLDSDGDKALQIDSKYLAFVPYEVDNGDTENNVTVFSMDMSLELSNIYDYPSEYIRFYSEDEIDLQYRVQIRSYEPETAFCISKEGSNSTGHLEVASSNFNFRTEFFSDGYLRFTVNGKILYEGYRSDVGGCGRIVWEHSSENIVRIDNVTVQNTYIER